jgi:hypothetical protein
MDKIQQYRQPMVTATGIFLGFMLNFTSNWIPKAFSQNLFNDTIVAISILLCTPLLMVVLFRILRMNYPANLANEYYKKTLILFLIAVFTPFFGFLIIMVEKIVTNVF